MEQNDTEYAGIDYGMGQTNINKETGIRYGVISQHSISPECWDAFEADYGKPTCPSCAQDVADSGQADDETSTADWFDHKDYYCATCKECYWSDNVYSEEPLGHSFEDNDYSVTDCLTSDWMILKSPYYTRAQYCSPCVPGAGNLDNPCQTGPKTYCFGHDWFDDGCAPYRVFRVADDTEVLPETAP